MNMVCHIVSSIDSDVKFVLIRFFLGLCKTSQSLSNFEFVVFIWVWIIRDHS